MSQPHPHTAGAPAAVPPVRKLALPVMVAYALGAVAFGVKDNGFGTFLLIFYDQVMGMPAAKVGFVIMCALLIDAFIDPLIGVLSDGTRTRWGRRHPWMYGAAMPIAVGWLLLWNPPGWSEAALLAWLFACAVLVRTAVSAYEVPSMALTPELSAGYDERTRIMAFRYLFGWTGGLAMLAAAYLLFLVPTEAQPNGLLNRDGYGRFALAGAVVMAGAILISALGTHREIPFLPKPEVRTVRRPRRAALAEFAQTVRNRGFLILLGAGLALFTNQGVGFALSNYLYTWVWHFTLPAFMWLAGTLLVGALAAAVVAPRMGARFGKPRAAAGFAIAGAILFGTPYWLRLIGLFPDPDGPYLLWVLMPIYGVNNLCSVSAAILGASMMADVVEDSEARTGRRSEGVFFAGLFFVQKCTSGIGIAVAGLILFLVGFPEQAQPGNVPVATIDRLTIVFSALYLALGLTGAFLFSRFPFGRAEHMARVARLAQAGDGRQGVL